VTYVTRTGADGTDAATEQYFYDLSGRNIGYINPRGRVLTRQLLASSGFGQNEALVTRQTWLEHDAPNARWLTQQTLKFGYDVFQHLRVSVNGAGLAEERTYDRLDRLSTISHEARSATAGDRLIDTYGYDELGHRTKHWNNVYGTVEKTFFDFQGRVVETTDFEGASTYAS